MKKVMLIARHEFGRHVTSRGFLIGTLVTPLVFGVIWFFTSGFGPQMGTPDNEMPASELADTIGYVDRAGLIRRIPEPVPEGMFRAYPDAASAAEDLTSGKIGAYYLLPADYRETGRVQRFSRELPANPADRQWLNWLLIGNIVPQADRQELVRLRQPLGGGPQFVDVNAAQPDTASSNNPMLPFIVTMAIMLPLFTGGAYLLQSLTQEKSNRVMEPLLLSLRPRQLLAGKMVGVGGLTAAQYASWVLMGAIALGVTGTDWQQITSQIRLSSQELALVIPYALGGYILYAALMAGIGALAPDLDGGRTWVFLVSLPMLIPIYLWSAIVNSPNGILAIALGLFPFSAPVAMLMRMTSSAVPAWQIALSLILLLLTGVGTIALMARLFRAQTLLSGESLSLRRFWSALWSA